MQWKYLPILLSQRLMFNRDLDLGVKVEFAKKGKPKYPVKNPCSRTKIDKSQSTCRIQDSVPDRKGGRCD